ncbi:uncharacterized protein LOC134540041 [Bacillus rossius redtenbacheri]|uniref:uncharacterized protein LOC134540041 n=1 Tax=Bacillus rossius redtenbacheri TaxID=93214 RepID=UPI002FDDE64C
MTRAAILLSLLLAAGAAHAQQLDSEEGEEEDQRDARQAGGYYTSLPQQSRSPSRFNYRPDDDEALSRNTVAPSPAPALLSGQSAYRPRGQAPLDSAAQQQRPQPQLRRPPPPAQTQQQLLQEEQLRAEEELEEEKPDRLTLLLPQSKFDCAGKTGYYADDGLNCEVFHYCQDNQRHSWICPEGFLFHQVHLICMPPSGDNICKQSTQYHFVNDYLYRPINTEEAQSRPNVTLRYSDRYYPDNYYENLEEQPQPQQPQQQVVYTQPSPLPQRIPLQTVAPQRARPLHVQAVQRPVQLSLQPTPRLPQVVSQQQLRPQPTQQQQLRPQPPTQQVFRSPEEVNIPLQHRRPAPTTPQPPRTYQPVNEDEEDYDYDDPPFRG